MKIQDSVTLLKALADSSRLRIAGALKEKPHYVEELSERLGLAISTISAHLKKLEEAGLVRSRREQYYIVYSLNEGPLEQRLLDFLIDTDEDQDKQRLQRYRQKVLKAFFADGRLTRLPAQHKKRWIVYEEFLALFEPGTRYDESEVNQRIMTLFDDYCTVRRELIEEGALLREDGQYWRPEPQKQIGAFQQSWEESITNRK